MTDFFTDLAAGNERYVRAHRRLSSGVPARGLAVVTCMDARIDPLRVLHLKLGEAVVLRVAGAQVDETVLRNLSVAKAALRVDRVLVMAHTDCAANKLTAEELRAAADGVEVRLDGRGERNPEEALNRDLDRLLRAPALRQMPIAGAVYDVVTGRVRITRRHGNERSSHTA
jgi:carbonic anhydrase